MLGLKLNYVSKRGPLASVAMMSIMSVREVFAVFFANAFQLIVASFTKEVNPRLAKRPLKSNGPLANRGLTSLVIEATGSLNNHIVLKFDRHLHNSAYQTAERSDHSKYKSSGLETLRDLTIRHLIGYWNSTQGLSQYREYIHIYIYMCHFKWIKKIKGQYGYVCFTGNPTVCSKHQPWWWRHAMERFSLEWQFAMGIETDNFTHKTFW